MRLDPHFHPQKHESKVQSPPSIQTCSPLPLFLSLWPVSQAVPLSTSEKLRCPRLCFPSTQGSAHVHSPPVLTPPNPDTPPSALPYNVDLPEPSFKSRFGNFTLKNAILSPKKARFPHHSPLKINLFSWSDPSPAVPRTEGTGQLVKKKCRLFT